LYFRGKFAINIARKCPHGFSYVLVYDRFNPLTRTVTIFVQL